MPPYFYSLFHTHILARFTPIGKLTSKLWVSLSITYTYSLSVMHIHIHSLSLFNAYIYSLSHTHASIPLSHTHTSNLSLIHKHLVSLYHTHRNIHFLNTCPHTFIHFFSHICAPKKLYEVGANYYKFLRNPNTAFLILQEVRRWHTNKKQDGQPTSSR